MADVLASVPLMANMGSCVQTIGGDHMDVHDGVRAPSLDAPFQFPMQQSTASEEPLVTPSANNISVSRRSRRQESVAKLPTFEFNPGTPSDIKASVSTPPDSPVPSAPTTPRSSRHRRTDSECVAGDVPVPVPVPALPVIPSQPTTAPKRGHRHRRSGAVSQDFTGLPGRSSAEQLNHLAMLDPTAIQIPNAASLNYGESTNASVQPDLPQPSSSSHRSSPSRLDFGSIPQQLSQDRPGRVSQSMFLQPSEYMASTMRSRSTESSTRKRRKFETSPQRPPLPQRPASSPVLSECERITGAVGPEVTQVVESVDIDAVDLSALDDPVFASESLNSGELGLSENFEEDPTASVISTATHSPSLASRGPPSPSLGDTDKIEPIIDLDEALDDGSDAFDTKSIKGKGSNAARRSMHSSQLTSGFFPGLQYHRRTESAPQLVPSAISRPELRRFGSSTASDKGFKIEDVFEEEEEEFRSKRNSMTRVPTIDQQSDALGIGIEVVDVDRRDSNERSEDERTTPTLPAAGLVDFASHRQDSSAHDTPRASRHQTPVPGFRRSNDMFTVVDADDANIDGQPSHSASLEAMKPHDTSALLALPPLRTSPMNSGFFTESTLSTPLDGDRSINTNSTFSTPRLDTAASSINSRKVSAPTSTLDSSEDASLSVRSRQRRSSALRYFPRRRSPMSSTANRQSGSGASFASHSDDRSSKRASIASLSQLIGRSFGDKSRGSSMMLDQDPRCQTSDGLGMSEVAVEQAQQQTKEKKKKKRLTNLFKFWKAGEGGSASSAA